MFAQPHGLSPTGEVVKHYYVSESVGIATGLLIAVPDVNDAQQMPVRYARDPQNADRHELAGL